MACAGLQPAFTWTNVDLQFPWPVVLYIEFKNEKFEKHIF